LSALVMLSLASTRAVSVNGRGAAPTVRLKKVPRVRCPPPSSTCGWVEPFGA
jgi:hypothetical protein